VTPAELASLHPRLFHLTTPEGLDGIRRRGLWPASRLLELFEVDPSMRGELERRRRHASAALDHPLHGRAVLSDNLPLSEAKLGRVLDDGLTPGDWLQLLNRRVFFWADEGHAMNLRNARAYRDQPRRLLVFDTAALAERYPEAIEIAPINTGATLHQPARRGLATFAPLLSTDYGVWRRRRGLKAPDRIKEVTVAREMPDACEFLLEVRP
jgi:hypothetical protein